LRERRHLAQGRAEFERQEKGVRRGLVAAQETGNGASCQGPQRARRASAGFEGACRGDGGFVVLVGGLELEGQAAGAFPIDRLEA
jgi:hypothetical protein